MFYKMIAQKRDKWYSGDCPVKDLIAYIENTNQMRDAQVEAIKTYLFLKIACGNQSLADLFSIGAFNTLDLDSLEVSTTVRDVLKANPALAALYEYTSLEDDKGNKVSEKICTESKDFASLGSFPNKPCSISLVCRKVCSFQIRLFAN